MGNLPTSRTETLVAGAPISHNLLNEIQDVIVGGLRAAWKRSVWPMISSGAANVTEAANPAGGSLPPVRKFSAAGGIYLEIPYDEGDTVSSLSFQGYGDGAVDVTVDMVYGSGYSVAQLTLSSQLVITNAPATWTAYSLASFVPTLLSAGPLSIIITANAANFYFGRMLPTFSRPL